LHLSAQFRAKTCASKGTYFIALGHELIHVDRGRLGVIDFTEHPNLKTYEECETITRENLLRA